MLLASSPRVSAKISNFVNKFDGNADPDRPSCPPNASRTFYMYERSIAPNDRAVTDLVLSFLRSAFKHLSCMSPPSSAESLTQDTLDSMTSGLKNLLTAPLIVIATGHWGLEQLRKEVRAPDRTFAASVYHSGWAQIPCSKWEYYVRERNQEGEGPQNRLVRAGSPLNQEIMSGNRELYVRSEDDKEVKEDRDNANENDKYKKRGTEEGSQSFDFVDCWKLLFGWWLDLTDRLDEQKRIDGTYSPTPTPSPSLAPTPGSLFSPAFDEERNRERGWRNVESEKKTSRGSGEVDGGQLEDDCNILNGEGDDAKNTERKTEGHHSNTNLLINLLSAPPRMPLPLSPLLPFSLSPVRLYRNRDPDPRIPHPIDNGNLSALYLIRNPLMEFGGVVPFIGKTGSPCSTPISCPDILLSLDLITRASDALEVSSIHIIIFHKIIFIFLDLFFSMCSFPPILGLKFQVSDVLGRYKSTRQY